MPILHLFVRSNAFMHPVGERATRRRRGSKSGRSRRRATSPPTCFSSRGEVAGFYSLGMSEVELRSQHRKGISASHPRQGAVLILWLARAANASVDAATILRHAVGIAQIGSRKVGAAVIAVDPFDAATEDYWRQHFGFRPSLTKRRDADGEQRSRLWQPLFPAA